jgi:hypothetical protein
MRALVHTALFFAFVLFVHSQTGTSPFTCPSTYQPANSCTAGPCRCAVFQTVQIQTGSYPSPTNPAVNVVATFVEINVTNLCDSTNPVYYVQFNLNNLDNSIVLIPYELPTTYSGNYNWKVSTFNGANGVTTPGLNWLRFAPSTGTANTQMVANTVGNYQWEIFQFIVQDYPPTFPWYFQMHQGGNYDTFGPLDMSLCYCANCDSGFIQRIILPCTLGYPNSDTTLSNSIFNEDIILFSYAINNDLLQMFYTDEHALTLGISQVNFPNGTKVSFPVTPTPSSPSCYYSPNIQVGNTNFNSHNLLSNVDVNGAVSSCTDTTALPCGRPMPPTLFITDLTEYGANSRAGDWQYGGPAYLPDKLCGTWKWAIKTIPSGVLSSTNVVTVVPTWCSASGCSSSDPPLNENSVNTGWNLGPGSDPLPFDFIVPGSGLQTYGAEIAWNIDNLGLNPAHTYRFQFMVHDGDQAHPGGDIGQGCIEVTAACPPGFSGPNCTACDVFPKPIDNTYTWYCLPLDGAYKLIKIPRSRENDTFYAGGFIPLAGTVDISGYNITCDCQRITYSCPVSCCGNGNCNQQNGTCSCFTPPSTLVSTATCCLLPPTPTPTPSPTPTPTPTPSPTPTPPVGTPITPSPPPTPTPTPTPTPVAPPTPNPPPNPPTPPCFNCWGQWKC